MSQTKLIELPADQADRLQAAAKAMGLELPAYLHFLEVARRSKLDIAAQDAMKYVFSTQADSLRKLAQ